MRLPLKFRFRIACWAGQINYHWGKSAYRQLSEDELKDTRFSDTVFVFGSGASIRDISTAEWNRIAVCNTVSFNWFPHQNYVRIDYHLIREVCSDDLRPEIWKPQIEDYSRLIRENSHYYKTVFVVQSDFTALNTYRLIGGRKLPIGAAFFPFRTRSRSIADLPSDSFKNGLVHARSSLFDSVNFAFIMGWKRIVLAGVDLYDRRYFWLKENERRVGDIIRSATVETQHNTAESTVLVMGKWREHMAEHGAELMVYNPRSLLTEVLPVFDWQDVQPGNSGQV